MRFNPNGYIHIGPVKTGTTYVQKTFFDNTAVFERYGIAYPFASPSPDAPRYTNAMFLWDRSRDDEARRILRSRPQFLISEEAIFFQPWTLRHPAFDSLKTKIILYVRRPAELILSWVAECAKPYNASIKSLPDVEGPLSVPDGIKILSKHYEEGIWRFIAYAAGARDDLDATIRVFDRDSFVDHDFLSDFLSCLELDAKVIRAEPDFVDPGPINASASRRFCDVSHATWQLLGRPRLLQDYNLPLVEDIVSQCKSGDTRPVIETVADEIIEALTERFAFYEKFLSDRFLGGSPIFKDRYPPIFGKIRDPHVAIDRNEVQQLLREKL